MEFLKFLFSLIVIVDPVFAAVLVAGLVDTPAAVKELAFRSSLTVLIASLLTFFTGETLLKLIGVNLFSIKIFGGLILLHMAFQMLQAKPPKTKHTREEEEAAVEKEDFSVIPIGIPILFGPGAFTTLLIFKEEAETVSSRAFLLLSLFALALIVYFSLLYSVKLSGKIGKTGINVLTRVFGLFTGALGSQFIVDGVKHLWIQG